MARAESCEALTEAGGAAGGSLMAIGKGLSPLLLLPGIPVPHEVEVSLGLLECPHDIVCGFPQNEWSKEEKKK